MPGLQQLLNRQTYEIKNTSGLMKKLKNAYLSFPVLTLWVRPECWAIVTVALDSSCFFYSEDAY